MHLSIRNLKKDKGPGLIKSWAPAVLLESARPEQLPDSPTDMKSDPVGIWEGLPDGPRGRSGPLTRDGLHVAVTEPALSRVLSRC
jgi:hypothetical protein